MSHKVLVVAAHSDDEALGCAGTLARHISAGDSVGIVFMTDGVSSRSATDESLVQERYNAAKKAADILGATIVKQFSFEDNAMDNVAFIDVVKAVESVISNVQPDIIYTHYANDLNIDHCITHRAIMTACRPQLHFSVKEIYSFEVLSSTEWSSKSEVQFYPQLLVDITEQWETKLKVIECYNKEMREAPHSRSIEAVAALATLRGNTHGFSKAEAFFVERILR